MNFLKVAKAILICIVVAAYGLLSCKASLSSWGDFAGGFILVSAAAGCVTLIPHQRIPPDISRSFDAWLKNGPLTVTVGGVYLGATNWQELTSDLSWLGTVMDGVAGVSMALAIGAWLGAAVIHSRNGPKPPEPR